MEKLARLLAALLLPHLRVIEQKLDLTLLEVRKMAVKVDDLKAAIAQAVTDGAAASAKIEGDLKTLVDKVVQGTPVSEADLTAMITQVQGISGAFSKLATDADAAAGTSSGGGGPVQP